MDKLALVDAGTGQEVQFELTFNSVEALRIVLGDKECILESHSAEALLRFLDSHREMLRVLGFDGSQAEREEWLRQQRSGI